MWCQIVVTAIASCCMTTVALAQTLQPSAQDVQVQAKPLDPTAGALGVDIHGTLNPIPPTSATNQLIAPSLPIFANTSSEVHTGFNDGPVTMYPAITSAVYYDDNVFALPTHPLGDWAFVVRPELSFRSNGWEKLDLGGNFYFEGRKYVRYDSEDVMNAGGWMGGQYQLGKDSQIIGRVAYVHGHEDRGASETITESFLSPITYDQIDLSAALNNRWDKLWTSVGATSLLVQYGAGTLADGTTISQNYRSGAVERVPLRLGYVVAPLTSVFIEASGNSRDFEVGSYNSEGFRVVGGVLLEPGTGSRVHGEVFGGYMNQSYNSSAFEPVSTWTAGGSMAFLATDQLTLTLEGRRDAREASPSGGEIPDDGVSVIESVASARVDYNVLPNVVISAGGSYLQDIYKGAARTDWAWSPLGSIKYVISPRFTVSFDYRHVDFDSTGVGVDPYLRNVYLLSLHTQF